MLYRISQMTAAVFLMCFLPVGVVMISMIVGWGLYSA